MNDYFNYLMYLVDIFGRKTVCDYFFQKHDVEGGVFRIMTFLEGEEIRGKKKAAIAILADAEELIAANVKTYGYVTRLNKSTTPIPSVTATEITKPEPIIQEEKKTTSAEKNLDKEKE